MCLVYYPAWALRLSKSAVVIKLRLAFLPLWLRLVLSMGTVPNYCALHVVGVLSYLEDHWGKGLDRIAIMFGVNPPDFRAVLARHFSQLFRLVLQQAHLQRNEFRQKTLNPI